MLSERGELYMSYESQMFMSTYKNVDVAMSIGCEPLMGDEQTSRKNGGYPIHNIVRLSGPRQLELRLIKYEALTKKSP